MPQESVDQYTLQRSESKQLGLAVRDNYQMPLSAEQEGGQISNGIMSALAESLNRCEGQKRAWTRRKLR